MAHALGREHKHFDLNALPVEEEYDLVIVGGGISGLAAGCFWRQVAGQNSRILILDNHDDFGGHAKRNEFTSSGKKLPVMVAAKHSSHLRIISALKYKS